jgi:putative tryptophan/tyrosine transport system substrate-binding protein
MRRREFIKIIVGSAGWPLAARAQPSNKPAIGFLSARSAKESAHLVDAFRKGLAEHGIVEGQNVTVDYSWADSHYERLAAQASDLLARQPAVLISVGGDMTAKVAVGYSHDSNRCRVHWRPSCGRVCRKSESAWRQYYRR